MNSERGSPCGVDAYSNFADPACPPSQGASISEVIFHDVTRTSSPPIVWREVVPFFSSETGCGVESAANGVEVVRCGS